MALSLGLKIARALTQGSLADSATLGWRTQSLWDCRTTGLSVVPYGNGRAGNIRKALAEILAVLDQNVRAPKDSRCAWLVLPAYSVRDKWLAAACGHLLRASFPDEGPVQRGEQFFVSKGLV